MAIKLGTHKRAKIEDEFLEEYRNALLKRIEKLQANNWNPNQVSQEARNLKGVIRFAQGDEYAVDRMKTRLRSLQYEAFSVVKRKKKTYLAAMTDGHIITQSSSQNQLDIGPFVVYLSTECLTAKSLNAPIHLIPVWQPAAIDRHPHHGARKIDKSEHPLDWSVRWCWGSFGSLIRNMLSSGDLVEVYRTLYIFLTKWNPNSELTRGWKNFAKAVEK